jgi:hypothetical protein
MGTFRLARLELLLSSTKTRFRLVTGTAGVLLLVVARGRFLPFVGLR